MTVVVRCPLPSCNKMTGWSYPNFQWARAHVDGVPPRVFIHVNRMSMQGMSNEPCPDPFVHVNLFRRARDPDAVPLMPDDRYEPPPEDPVDDPNATLSPDEEVWGPDYAGLSIFDVD